MYFLHTTDEIVGGLFLVWLPHEEGSGFASFLCLRTVCNGYSLSLICPVPCV